MSNSVSDCEGPPRTRPFPWKCGHCRQRSVQPAVVPYSTDAEHDGRMYTVHVGELRVPRCSHCGRMVFDDAANEQVSDALRRLVGLLSPAEIRAGREALGLTQRQLAEHLGVPEASVSLWETGEQIQQRAQDRLVRVYFAFPDVRAALADEAALAGLAGSLEKGVHRLADVLK